MLQPTLLVSVPGRLREICGGWGMTPAWLYVAYSLLAVAASALPLRRSNAGRRLAVSGLPYGSLVLVLLVVRERLAGSRSWIQSPLLDLAIEGRTCAPDPRLAYGSLLAVIALAIALLVFDAQTGWLPLGRDLALIVATAVSLVAAVTHVVAGSGFGTFVQPPRTNAFAALMLFFVACMIGLYRSQPSPYQWLVRHAYRRALTRVLMIVVLFPSAVLLGDSLFSDLGIDEQVSEAAAIAVATIFVAAMVARFSWREEHETHLRLQLAAELVRSEAHYRLLAENSVDVVAKFDADNRLEWVSPSVTAVLGWSPEELWGKRAEEIAHPEDLASNQMGRAELQRTGTTAYRIRISCKDGSYRWIGVRGRVVTDESGGFAGISASLRDIQHEVEAEQRLDRLARLDSLTGLLNRAEAYERIGEMLDAAGGQRIFALLFCDMDNLKELNDEHGHAAGDAVLRELSGRIQASVRSGDFVARIGGDEFLVVLTNVETATEVLALAERIRLVASNGIDFGGVPLHTSLSIGVALSERDQTVEAAVMRADRAMYRAKVLGRNRVVLDESTKRLS